jgi:hypothetical protein
MENLVLRARSESIGYGVEVIIPGFE